MISRQISRDATFRYVIVLTQLLLTLFIAVPSITTSANQNEQTKFRRIPTQFIAALADPASSSGNNAQSWGLWRTDPGVTGVWLNQFDSLEKANGLAPAQWQFDESDWWLEEHGIIMEKPEFPLPSGKYVVTGDREVRTILTVHPKDSNGDQKWELDFGASLYDVTHLPCRSARYTPAVSGGSCTPAEASESLFPVSPGAVMPAVNGCKKLDYAVLFVIGVEAN